MTRIDEILAAERPGFARAVKAVIAGDVRALRAELSPEPELVWARSSSAHRATLLLYTAANGIEAGSPACAEESKSSAPSSVMESTLTRARPGVIEPEPRSILQPTKGRSKLPPFSSSVVPSPQSGMRGIGARHQNGRSMRRADDDV